jgi:hypothetical protein
MGISDIHHVSASLAPYDDKPVPKIIDFGLAKAMHQSLTERTPRARRSPRRGAAEGLSIGGGVVPHDLPGDIVLTTTDSSSQVNPISLSFGATSVSAGGAQIATIYGAFTAKVQAFDANGKSLASFTETGNCTNSADNSAIFIGISSSSANIHEIALSVTKASYNLGKGDVTINKFDFRTSPLAAAVPTVRQPGSGLNLAPLASSLSGTEQSGLSAVPQTAEATSNAPPANESGGLPASGASSAAPARATVAIFAASHPAANDDDTWLFAPMSSVSLDAM